jgi:DNA-binding NarL/FixJ family response regulator
MMSPIRLLIIEEHVAVRDALQVRLQSSSNLEVVAAYGSILDWEGHSEHTLLETAVDVVLLGLKSSGQYPLRTTIRDIKNFKRMGTAVIVLASFADDIERELVLQAGAHRYLLKDINSSQLIAEIEALAGAQVN